MITGVDNILKIYDSLPSNVFCWKLYNGGANGSVQNYIDECGTDIADNKDMARQRLESVLSMLNPGTYRLDIKENLEKTKNFRSLEIYINHKSYQQPAYMPAIGNPTGFQQSGLSKEDVAEMIKRETEKIHAEYKLRELQKEVKELTAKLNNQTENTAMAAVGKFINSDHGKLITGIIAQKIMGNTTPIGIAGFDAKPIPPETEETTTETITQKQEVEILEDETERNLLLDRLDNVISKFVELEKSEEKVVVMLENLYDLSQKKPEMYAMAKSFL